MQRYLWDLLADLPETDPGAALRERLLSGSPQRVVRFSRAVATAAQALLSRAGGSGLDADLLLALSVVAEGRESYEKVLTRPDHLWQSEPDEFGEALMVLPGAAYESLTGLTLSWSDEHGLVDDPYIGGSTWLTSAGVQSGPKSGLPRGYVAWIDVLAAAVGQDPGLIAWWNEVRGRRDEGVEFSIIAGRQHGSQKGTVRVRQHPTWIEVEVHSKGHKAPASALALAIKDLSSGLLRLAEKRKDTSPVLAGLKRVALPAVSLALRASVKSRSAV